MVLTFGFIGHYHILRWGRIRKKQWSTFVIHLTMIPVFLYAHQSPSGFRCLNSLAIMSWSQLPSPPASTCVSLTGVLTVSGVLCVACCQFVLYWSSNVAAPCSRSFLIKCMTVSFFRLPSPPDHLVLSLYCVPTLACPRPRVNYPWLWHLFSELCIWVHPERI